MQIYNANYWEDAKDYSSKKKKASNRKKSSLKRIKQRKERQKHNTEMIERSACYAEDMKENPSELEKRMQRFLDNFNVKYQFQKVFNIKRKSGYIKRFYIADFYIPQKNIIIETDGIFHDKQVKKDEDRTKRIQNQYPNVKVIRWRWHDFDSYAKMKTLLSIVR